MTLLSTRLTTVGTMHASDPDDFDQHDTWSFKPIFDNRTPSVMPKRPVRLWQHLVERAHAGARVVGDVAVEEPNTNVVRYHIGGEHLRG